MTISIQLTVVFHPSLAGNVGVGASTKLKLCSLRAPIPTFPRQGKEPYETN